MLQEASDPAPPTPPPAPGTGRCRRRLLPLGSGGSPSRSIWETRRREQRWLYTSCCWISPSTPVAGHRRRCGSGAALDRDGEQVMERFIRGSTKELEEKGKASGGEGVGVFPLPTHRALPTAPGWISYGHACDLAVGRDRGRARNRNCDYSFGCMPAPQYS